MQLIVLILASRAIVVRKFQRIFKSDKLLELQYCLKKISFRIAKLKLNKCSNFQFSKIVNFENFVSFGLNYIGLKNKQFFFKVNINHVQMTFLLHLYGPWLLLHS